MFSFRGKKTLFIFYGFINVFITNLILQICLIILPVLLSTFFAQLFNFTFGFYFYGRNVFLIKKLNIVHLKKYLILNILIWNTNWILISFLTTFNISKNISALSIIPLLAFISYFIQRFFVFNK